MSFPEISIKQEEDASMLVVPDTIAFNIGRVKQEPVDYYESEPATIEHVTVMGGSDIKTEQEEVNDFPYEPPLFEPMQMEEMCVQQIKVEPDEVDSNGLLEVIPTYVNQTEPSIRKKYTKTIKTKKAPKPPKPPKPPKIPKPPKNQKTKTPTSKYERRLYECVYCHKTFRYKAALVSHLEVDFVYGPLDCTFCYHTFPTHRCCVEHMDAVHLATNPVECEAEGCSEKFRTILSRDRHLQHAHSMYICNFCNEKFHLKGLLKVHRKVHRPDYNKLELRTCVQCGKVASSVTTLQEHIAMVHEVDEVQCDECPNMFQNKTRLYRHKLRYHRDRPTYVCQYCGLRQTRIWELNTHIALRHNPDNAFQCKACHYRYPTEEALGRHSTTTKCKRVLDAIHLTPRPPPKRNDRPCKFKTDNPELADIHRDLVKRDPYATYQCAYCHLDCPGLYVLTRHLRTNEMNNFVRRTRCLVCDKHLPNLFCLRNHIRNEHRVFDVCPVDNCLVSERTSMCSHIETRHTLIECSLCNTVARGKTDWVRHIEIHNHRKRFKCDACDDSFNNFSKKIRHMVKHHRGIKCDKCGIHIDRNTLPEHGVQCKVKKATDKAPSPASNAVSSNGENEFEAITPDMIGDENDTVRDLGGFVEYMFT